MPLDEDCIEPLHTGKLPALLTAVNAQYQRTRDDRGQVYGPPRENHIGIAQMWAPLLQPHWQAIRRGDPLPEHVVALMMVALKLDRMRLAFSADNYLDLVVYLGFAHDWQREHKRQSDAPHNLYVSGPFSADTDAERFTNLLNAVVVGAYLMQKGYHVHVPHAATAFWHGVPGLERGDFLALDRAIIVRWADAGVRLGPSPGADWERDLAQSLNVPVLTLEEARLLPSLTGWELVGSWAEFAGSVAGQFGWLAEGCKAALAGVESAGTYPPEFPGLD